MTTLVKKSVTSRMVSLGRTGRKAISNAMPCADPASRNSRFGDTQLAEEDTHGQAVAHNKATNNDTVLDKIRPGASKHLSLQVLGEQRDCAVR
jgi:hypothetical protein